MRLCDATGEKCKSCTKKPSSRVKFFFAVNACNFFCAHLQRKKKITRITTYTCNGPYSTCAERLALLQERMLPLPMELIVVRVCHGFLFRYHSVVQHPAASTTRLSPCSQHLVPISVYSVSVPTQGQRHGLWSILHNAPNPVRSPSPVHMDRHLRRVALNQNFLRRRNVHGLVQRPPTGQTALFLP